MLCCMPGDRSMTEETITINNRFFSLGFNLCDVLCALSNRTELDVVWLDAIYINQTDDAEKVT